MSKDRHYAVLLQLMSLSDTGINSFRLLVLDPVTEEVTQTLLKQIMRSRKEEEVNLDVVDEALKVCVVLCCIVLCCVVLCCVVLCCVVSCRVVLVRCVVYCPNIPNLKDIG